MVIDREKVIRINGEIPIDVKQASEYIGEIQKSGGGIKDVGGALAESLKKKFKIDPRDEKNINTLISKLDNFRKTDPSEKARSIGEEYSKRSGGDKKLEDSIKTEAEKVIKNRNVKPKKDKVKELQKSVNKSTGVEISDVEATRIVEEMGKHEINNIETIRKIRKEEVVETIKKEYLNINPTLDEKQLKAITDQAEIAADIFYTGPGIENIRDEVLAGTSGENVDLNQAWTDLEGTIKLLKNTTPNQLKALQEKYVSIKEKLVGLNQPTNVRELTSVDSIMGALGNSEVMRKFNMAQNNVLGWADRINGWTGGALSRTFTNWGGQFISKIGNESARNFAQKAFNIFTKSDGFQAGFNALTQTALKKGASFLASKAAALGAKLGLSATGVGTLLVAAWEVLKKVKKIGDGIKKIGERIKNAFNNLVTSRGEDEDINKLTKKKWFIPIVIIVLLLAGCTLQNNQISTMVSPTKTKKNSYELVSNGGFSVPKCDPTVNNREILRDIALSVVGKIKYDHEASWRCIGACPNWITKKNGVDCAKLVSWVWLQCTGLSRSKEFGTTDNLVSTLTHKTPGWQRIYPNSLDDLKIGDMLVRIDKCKDGSRCNHAAIYIGKGDDGVDEVLETVGNGGDPIITKIYSVKSGKIKLVRDKNRYSYPYTIRITNVFND